MSKELETKVVETAIKSRAARPSRVPLDQRGKLGGFSIPGYYLRYINTDQEHHASRLHDARRAGYEPVLRKEVFGEDCDNPNDIHRLDSASKPMLVKLPEEYREEDLSRKRKVTEALVADKSKGGSLEMSRN